MIDLTYILLAASQDYAIDLKYKHLVDEAVARGYIKRIEFLDLTDAGREFLDKHRVGVAAPVPSEKGAKR